MVSFPTFPHQNNLFSHDGWPGLDAFSCDASNVTGAVDPVCHFAVVEDSNLKGEIRLMDSTTTTTTTDCVCHNRTMFNLS